MHKEINHPLIKVKLSRMRNKNTDSRDFRSNLIELSQFMAFEVMKNIKLKSFKIETPVSKTIGYKFANNVVLVPILRAGLGMVDGFKNMIPQASIGFIGLYRDEKTFKPVEYYCKMPECMNGSNVFILDPMLATGNSIVKAIDIIKKRYKPKNISVVCIVSVMTGIKLIEKKHPNVFIYTCSIDKKLNKKKYIIPGLGDAGDRIFGTK